MYSLENIHVCQQRISEDLCRRSHVWYLICVCSMCQTSYRESQIKFWQELKLEYMKM